MFFLFPIRSESRVRRFPVVTVSLIGLNILVFLFSYPAMSRQQEVMIEKELRLREVEYRTFSAEDPSAIIEYANEYAKDPVALRERIKKREIGMSDELWEEWKKAYDDLHTAWCISIYFTLAKREETIYGYMSMTVFFRLGTFGYMSVRQKI